MVVAFLSTRLFAMTFRGEDLVLLPVDVSDFFLEAEGFAFVPVVLFEAVVGRLFTPEGGVGGVYEGACVWSDSVSCMEKTLACQPSNPSCKPTSNQLPATVFHDLYASELQKVQCFHKVQFRALQQRISYLNSLFSWNCRAPSRHIDHVANTSRFNV